MSGDTRKTRTGHYLIDALIEITRYKNINTVTVKELCSKAQVNRTTFYKYYHDFSDFLKRITANFIDEMTRYVDRENPYSQLLFGDDPLFYFTRCVEFMNAHADFMRMMVGKNGSLEFQERVKGVWVAQIYEALLAEQSKLEGLDIDIQAHFIASGMWGLLLFNLNDMKYSVSHIANQLELLVSSGIMGILTGHLLTQNASTADTTILSAPPPHDDDCWNSGSEMRQFWAVPQGKFRLTRPKRPSVEFLSPACG